MNPMIATIDATISIDPIEFCEVVAEDEVVKIFVEPGNVEIVVVFGNGETVVGLGIFDHFAIPFAFWIVPALWKPPPTNKLFDFVSKCIIDIVVAVIVGDWISTPFCIKSEFVEFNSIK